MFFIGPLIWIVLLILLIAFIASNIVIVPQARAYVIERLGTYRDTWNTGLHFKVPLFERIARKVTLKEQVVDFPPQPVITKDNVTMQIDTVVYFQITDPKMFTYGIESPMAAIENLTATTLRNIIGDLELDQTLTSRDIINTKMRAHPGRGDRCLGNQGQPRRAEEHHSAGRYSGVDGKADEGGARAPRGYSGRGRQKSSPPFWSQRAKRKRPFWRLRRPGFPRSRKRRAKQRRCSPCRRRLRILSRC